MKNCYIDYATRSIADVSCRDDWSDNPNEYYIHRINVPEGSRGLGHGSKLLKQICDDVDREDATLLLDPVPSGPLNRDDLREWYMRYGFREIAAYGRMERKPNPQLTSTQDAVTMRSAL